MKINFIVILLLLCYCSSFAQQNLLFFPIESEDVDRGNLSFVEIELHRKLSSYFDLNIERVSGEYSDFETVVKEFPSRYYLLSSITIEKENYIFFYEFFDLIKNKSVYKSKVEENSLDKLVNSLDDILIKLRSELRKPPSLESEKISQIVIQTDSVGADIYVDDEFIGISPISLSATVGSKLNIEARTESLKKNVEYVVEERGINEINLELEPIVGSFLLRGDVLGRTLYINNELVEIESSALFKDIPIGVINLKIESEWGSWEDSITIYEEKLTDVEVTFSSISKVELIIDRETKLIIKDISDSYSKEFYESQTITLPPGEYIFTTAKDGYVTQSIHIFVDPEILHEFITPKLTPLEVIEEVIITKTDVKEKNNKEIADLTNRISFWSSVGSGALLTLGVIGEIVAINMYEDSSLSADAMAYRETGENIMFFNIAVLTTGIVSVITYFVSGNYR